MIKEKKSDFWTIRLVEGIVMLPLYVLFFLAIINLSWLIKFTLLVIAFFIFTPLYIILFITRPSFINAIPRLYIAVFIWLLPVALFFYL